MERWMMTSIPQNLGQRILELARIAALMHEEVLAGEQATVSAMAGDERLDSREME